MRQRREEWRSSFLQMLVVVSPVRTDCFPVAMETPMTGNSPRHVPGIWWNKYITFHWNDVIQSCHLRSILAERSQFFSRGQFLLQMEKTQYADQAKVMLSNTRKNKMAALIPCSSELGIGTANRPYEIHLHISPLQLCKLGCLMDILGQKETFQLPLASGDNDHVIFVLMDQCLSPSSRLCFLCKNRWRSHIILL